MLLRRVWLLERAHSDGETALARAWLAPSACVRSLLYAHQGPPNGAYLSHTEGQCHAPITAQAQLTTVSSLALPPRGEGKITQRMRMGQAAAAFVAGLEPVTQWVAV
jgi:hypothetical protein